MTRSLDEKALGHKKSCLWIKHSLSTGVEKWKTVLFTRHKSLSSTENIATTVNSRWKGIYSDTLSGVSLLCKVTSVISVSTLLQCSLSMPKHQNRFWVSQTMELMQKLLTSFPNTLMRHWCHFSRVHGGFLFAVVLQQKKMLLHIPAPWLHPSYY